MRDAFFYCLKNIAYSVKGFQLTSFVLILMRFSSLFKVINKCGP